MSNKNGHETGHEMGHENETKTETGTESMTIDELNKNINDSITKLKTKIGTSDLNITDGTSIEEICKQLSDLNLLGDFNKELYSNLNRYFKINNMIDQKIEGHCLFIRNTSGRNTLSQSVFNYIVNGEWISEQKSEIIKKSLGKNMLRNRGILASLGISKKKKSKESEQSKQGQEQEQGTEQSNQGQEGKSPGEEVSGGTKIYKKKIKKIKK